jgi:hypothetical protein
MLLGKKNDRAAGGVFPQAASQEDGMRSTTVRFSSIVATGLAAGIVIFGVGSLVWTGPGGAITASAQTQERQALDRMRRSLQAVDVAYASGNRAEAQTRFAQARASWNSIARKIDAREAREQQLLLDSLASQLRSGAPATQVRSTISGMLDELREDIERELR